MSLWMKPCSSLSRKSSAGTKLNRHPRLSLSPTTRQSKGWVVGAWGVDSPELIDMPPRGCSLITYRSNRPYMQSICQWVSLARWDKCPLNTYDRAVLIKGGIRAHDHIEPTCQVFHIDPRQNLSSLAGTFSTSVRQIHMSLLLITRIQDSIFSVLTPRC